MRRQSLHLQHIYAVIFAGSITLLIGAAILYFDYGFWRDRYSRTESFETQEEGGLNTAVVVTKSPGDMFSDFMKEVSEKLEQVSTTSKDMLDGKDSYKRE